MFKNICLLYKNMGVKLPEIPRKVISFNELQGKIIAIDASNSLYQFLASIRQKDGTPLMDSKGNVTSHLQGLFSRTLNLINKGIKICYVFDGKPPSLKIYETEARENRKQLAEKKLKQAMEDEDITLMSKYAKQTSRLSFSMIQEAKDLVSAMGLPVIQAPSEAEAQASFMCKQGDVFAVGSSDHDCLLYSCPKLIQNLTLSQTRKLPGGGIIYIKPEIIELKQVLRTLDLNQDQLIVLAILIGTDYNRKGIAGIGPKNALKLVHNFKNFDALFKEVAPDFNWKQIFAIFKSMPVMENYKLKFNNLDEKKIKNLLIKKHEFSEERINKLLEKHFNEKEKKKQSSLGNWV